MDQFSTAEKARHYILDHCLIKPVCKNKNISAANSLGYSLLQIQSCKFDWGWPCIWYQCQGQTYVSQTYISSLRESTVVHRHYLINVSWSEMSVLETNLLMEALCPVTNYYWLLISFLCPVIMHTKKSSTSHRVKHFLP